MLVLGVAATLTVTLLPGTAAAGPERPTSAAPAARPVAEVTGNADVVARLGTLDAIAGRTDGVLARVARTAAAAEQARERAGEAAAEARRRLVDLTARQARSAAESAAHRDRSDDLPAPATGDSAAAQIAVETALAQVGDPYLRGAGGPDAFDCSGLVQYAYAAAGISLPHSSVMQSQLGTPVSRADLRPGDLVFYDSPAAHVAMYVGDGRMVHAPASGRPVAVVDVESTGGVTGMRRIAG